MVLATDLTRSIAIGVAVVVTLGWLLYLFANSRSTRAERGAEIELAANRKPYYDDDVLETKKLDRSLLMGVVFLIIVGVGLPLYWLNEPGRQAGAQQKFSTRYASWGSKDFATTADGGFNCAGCHGGMKAVGGVAAYTVSDPRTGDVREVSWRAPALNTVLSRFSVDSVTYILTYGRPFSPMSPWGIAGGGPMNDQQISDLIAYIKSIQISQADAQKQVADALDAARKANPGKSDGELLFNLDVASGAYSCARCHTKGWSYGDPQQSGGGAMGPNLTGGSTTRQFPNESDHIAFVTAGSVQGKRYGQQGQGSGRMPGFGNLLTPDQIRAIVEYERSL